MYFTVYFFFFLFLFNDVWGGVCLASLLSFLGLFLLVIFIFVETIFQLFSRAVCVGT